MQDSNEKQLQYNRRFAEKQKERGMVQVKVWVPVDKADDLKRVAEAFRGSD